jgi:hypothetical protein
MTPNELAELKNDEALRKRLAKFLARECFRNSRKLEEMHTDGKIGQEDMKELMIEAVNRTYLYLSVILANKASAEIIEYLEEHDPVPNWGEPEMPDDVLRDAKRAYDAIGRAVH